MATLTATDIHNMGWRDRRALNRMADEAIAAMDRTLESSLERIQCDLAPDQLERELAAEPALGIGRGTSDDE